MNIIKEYFDIPLILFGWLIADLSRHGFGEDILTFQIIAWSSVVIGVIGSARIVWSKVKR